MTLYEELGVSREATSEDIEAAWKRFAMKNHPDHGGDQKKFVKGSKAVAILRDPVRRKRYDETGNAEDTPDPESAALQAIQETLINLVKNNDLDFSQVNVIGLLKQTLGNVASNFKNEVLQHERALKRLGQAMLRTKYKGKSKDRMLALFEWQKKAVEDSRNNHQIKFDVVTRAVAILEEYDYSVDAPPQTRAQTFVSDTMSHAELWDMIKNQGYFK